MPSVTISEEDLVFLKDLAHELRTQNNRATATPIYYVVRKKKRIVGLVPGLGDDTVFVDSQDDYTEYKSEQEALASYIKDGLTPEEAQKRFDDICEEYGVLETHEEENFFLTHKGFMEHMRLNAHNYPGKQDGDNGFVDSPECHSFVKHAFRNPEIRKLVEVVLRLGGEKT